MPLYTSYVSAESDVFAKDTVLFDVQPCQNAIEKNLQIHERHVHCWFQNKGIVIN